MRNTSTRNALAAALGLAAATAANLASAADGIPSAFAGKLIYAVPARISAAPATLDPNNATYDVFIDGRTGYAFVRTPRGWTFVRDITSNPETGDARRNNDAPISTISTMDSPGK